MAECRAARRLDFANRHYFFCNKRFETRKSKTMGRERLWNVWQLRMYIELRRAAALGRLASLWSKGEVGVTSRRQPHRQVLEILVCFLLEIAK